MLALAHDLHTYLAHVLRILPFGAQAQYQAVHQKLRRAKVGNHVGCQLECCFDARTDVRIPFPPARARSRRHVAACREQEKRTNLLVNISRMPGRAATFSRSSLRTQLEDDTSASSSASNSKSTDLLPCPLTYVSRGRCRSVTKALSSSCRSSGFHAAMDFLYTATKKHGQGGVYTSQKQAKVAPFQSSGKALHVPSWNANVLMIRSTS